MVGKRFSSDDEVLARLRRLEHRVNSLQLGTGDTVVTNITETGVENLIELNDCPKTYVGAGNFVARVKSTVDELEFAELKGTTNQVVITPGAADYAWSLPQDYHTAATPTLAGLYLKSSSIASFLKLTNESDTERDPIIQYAVGATPVVKWTHGLDDSDGDKWKLAVGDEFGDAHDTIVVTSGEGSTPGVAEFTLIDSFAATSPAGICGFGAYLYYSDYTASQQLVKVDINTGAEITRSPDTGKFLRQCVTDGTYVYVVNWSDSVVRKHFCSDLSYDSSSGVYTGNPSAICYWSGHVYVVNLNDYGNVRKIRCSDMATIWTTAFTWGSGVNQMARGAGITTDGQYLYVQDCAYGNNRIVRLNMDGTWVDSVAVVNSMSYDSIAMWCAGDYVYNTAWYTSEYKIEKRNKSDLSISETFSVVPDQSQGGCQVGDYHYIVHSGNQFIYQYQYTTSPASATAGIQFRLKDVYGQFVDIAKLTAAGRFGVGTTIPSETIEAVGNIKAMAGQFISTKATGTAPHVVSSTTVCTNLNAGLVDGYHHDQSLLIAASPTFVALNLSATSNQIVLQSTGVTGTITATPASSNKVWTLQDVTGTIYQTGGTDVAVADGGTGASTLALNGILYGNAANAIGVTAIGAEGQILRVGASPFVPAWTTATFPATTTINQLLYSGTANIVSGLSTAASGLLVTSAGGVPSIAVDIPTAVTIGGKYIYRADGTDVPVADGGTGLSAGTSGGILGYTAAGTLASSAALTDSILLVGGGAGATPTSLVSGLGATTQYLRGNAGGEATWETLNQAAVVGLRTEDVPTWRGARMYYDVDGEASSIVRNTSAGTAAYSLFNISNGTSQLSLFQLGTGFTSSGAYLQNGSLLNANGVGGLTIASISATAPSIMFRTSAGEVLRILPNGNVGIGDTAPAEKLDVTGGINTTTHYHVADLQVVGARAAHIANATNATDVITQLNALLAALETHGLLSTS